MNRLICLLLAGLVPSASAIAAPVPSTTFAGAAALLPVEADRQQGRILITLPAPDREGVAARFIYVTSLKTGLGSAPVGLDRAAHGGSKLLLFRRVGKKVLAEVENPRFRATGAPAAEQAAARDSFAYSTLWAGDIVRQLPDGRLVVDIASFLTRDAMGIAARLKASGQGDYALKPELSAADPAAVRVFPDNAEFEARQTYVSNDPKAEIDNIAPAPGNLSFIVRHSLVRLPDGGYQPRRLDPRAGAFGTQVLDYAAPLGSPIVYELANRFRLEKLDPAAPRSRVRKPIVFYIDRSAPEPIRTALYEGTRWWADAFDAAGFIDALQVQILPEGVDPLDIRYNVVNWVNRATRGWSYGQVIEDPRTGEVIKSLVLLGSLRVRQDMLIYEGLVGADKVGTGGPNDPVNVALARLRQLAAHEAGHALGFQHNFAGSSLGRQSVMDYPAPRIGLVDGVPDLSDAYGGGLGAWDRFVVDWLYGAQSDEAARAKVDAALAAGLRYGNDTDARPIGTAQPYSGLWDDGGEPVAELARVMDVRRAAIDRFGLSALRPDEPVANLRRKFVPIWLLHRYQVESTVKLVGGVDYAYALRGDGREQSPLVPADRQRAALSALLSTLSPEALDVPPPLIPLMSGGVATSDDRQFDIELFETAGGPVFDPLAASEAAAAVTLTALLAPDRLNRLAEQERTAGQLGATEMVDLLIASTFAEPRTSERLAGVQRRVGTATAFALARAQRDPKLSPVSALALEDRLRTLASTLERRRDMWARGLARLLLDREALDKALAAPATQVIVPPGMPIGSASADDHGG